MWPYNDQPKEHQLEIPHGNYYRHNEYHYEMNSLIFNTSQT